MASAFLNNEAPKALVVFFILAATILLVGNKKIIVDPYVEYAQGEYIVAQGFVSPDFHDRSDISPMLSAKGYLPPTLALVPQSLLFDQTFNTICAFVFVAFLLATVYSCCRATGLDKTTSLLIVFAIKFYHLFLKIFADLVDSVEKLFHGSPTVAHDFLHHILKLPSPTPNLFWTYSYYDFRAWILPLALLGLCFLLKRRYFLSGLSLALVNLVHVKFGARSFAILVVCLAVIYFIKRMEGETNLLSRYSKAIFAFLVPYTAITGYLFYKIMATKAFWAALDVPKASALISPLAYMLLRTPDDWMLLESETSFIVQIFAFFLITVASWLFILKRTDHPQLRSAARVFIIAASVAMGFILFGILFELVIIDMLPWRISLSFLMLRSWDTIWIITTSFLISSTLLLYVLLKSVRPRQSYLRPANLFLVAFSLFALGYIGVKYIPDYKKCVLTEHLDKYAMKTRYTQVRSDDLFAVHERHRQALLDSLRANDFTDYEEHLQGLENNYRSALDISPDTTGYADPEALMFRAFRSFANGRFSSGSADLRQLKQIQTETASVVYSPSGDNGDGLKEIVVKIPMDGYQEATDWIDNNLPADAAIICHPRLPAVETYTRRAGFIRISSHMIYMVPESYPFILARLQAIAGPIVPEASDPRQLFIESRLKFLELTSEDFARIKSLYPHYNYVLTERSHELPLDILYQNEWISLYSLEGS